MNYLEPTIAEIDEDAKAHLADDSWGRWEQLKEIALLEAHLNKAKKGPAPFSIDEVMETLMQAFTAVEASSKKRHRGLASFLDYSLSFLRDRPFVVVY